MADNKGKTKAAMLQELESIKGLLRDEDDIPILQEVIGGSNQPPQQALTRHALDELQQEFQRLSETIAVSSKSTEQLAKEKAADISADLLDAFTRVSQHQPLAASQDAVKHQASLFQDNEAQDYADTDSSTQTDQDSARWSDPEPDHAERNKRAQRPTLAKAAGENPFLPQHIRARLHGNNPPPLFDFSVDKSSPVAATKTVQETKSVYESKTDNPVRQRLIQEVVASVLPQLEKELRQRLEELSEQELEKMQERS